MDLAELWNNHTPGQAVLDPWAESDTATAATSASAEQNPQTSHTQAPTTIQVPGNQIARENEVKATSDTPETRPQPPSLSVWAFNMPSIDRKPRRLMDEDDIETARNLELYKLHSVSFELDQGDTLVFVDSVSATRFPSSPADCNGIAYRSQKFRVHSEKLLATGSSKFSDMLGPTYQFRVMRRRGLVNKLPDGIKFVLDMTPPSEGDETVMQMMELSLTPGLIQWWTSILPHNVDMLLVSGHDDVCTCMRDAKKAKQAKQMEDQAGEDSAGQAQKQPKSLYKGFLNVPELNKRYDERYPNFPLTTTDILHMKKRGDSSIYTIPDYRRIPDYCPVRHRNNIIRLFMLIEGKEVTLDSASRVWTLVKLSKIWDCTSVTRDRVTQWIMYGQNSRLIEVLPEEALQIGFTLELPEVTQCAFRILVNELALKEAADEEAKKKLCRTTVFGRTLGDLPDELSNLVQHAARALVERITGILAKFRDPKLWRFRATGDWIKVLWLEYVLARNDTATQTEALYHTLELKDALFGDLKHLFEQSFDLKPQQLPYFPTMDQDRMTYVEPKNFDKLETIWDDLNPVQRMLMPFIYNEFGSKIDKGLYLINLINRDASVKHRPFEHIINDLIMELQQMVHINPSMMSDDTWSVLLESNPDAIVNGHIRKVRRNFISLFDLESEMKSLLEPITLSWMRHDIEPQLNITRHLLLTLASSELKYLPLWAGGCNDGTGGVFEAYVPPAVMGPNGPGPAFHTGFTVPSASSSTGTMVEDMRALGVMGSTTAGSVDVHDSVSTVYRPDRVIADDKTMDSESFTVGESDYQDARFQVPADHQTESQTLVAAVDTTDTESQATTTDAEDFLVDADDDDMSFWNDDSDNEDAIQI